MPSASPEEPGSRPDHATILFADVLGFDALTARDGVDRAYSTVTRVLTALDDVARRHGGAVDKYLGDALMVVFGFPVVGEEPEKRALSAALEMRELVALEREQEGTQALGLRVGVNTGPVYAADIGAHVVREFAVMGDAVNVAARLKSRAEPGDVLVGPATVAAAGDDFRFGRSRELALKGRRQGVTPSRLLDLGDGARRARRRSTSDDGADVPFVGRDAELAELDALARAAAAGVGHVSVWAGPAGSGETRLLRHWADRASNRDVEFHSVRTLPKEPPADVAGAVVVDDLHRAKGADWTRLRAWVEHAARHPTLLLLAGRDPVGAEWEAFERACRDAVGDRYSYRQLGELEEADVERLLDELEGSGILPAAARSAVKRRGAGMPGGLIQAAFLSDAIRADATRSAGGAGPTQEAERRRVTVLFADLSGFTARAETMAPSDLHALVSSCLGVMDETASEFGGTVQKHLGDCVLAVWGIPRAIEDGPRSAVAAATEMRRRVIAFNEERGLDPPLELHIGVDTGLGVFGDVSGPMIREWALMGEALTGAARLMDLAPPGEIFIGERTRRDVEDLVDATPAPSGEPDAFRVAQDARVLDATSVRRRSVRVATFVGRRRELAALAEAAALLGGGRGGFVCVEGEAGLGKTRLVAEFLAGLTPEGKVRVYEARSLPLARQRGFHTFASLLDDWFDALPGSRGDDKARSFRGRLRDLLGAEGDEVFPFLGMLMGLPLAADERERLAEIAGDALSRLILAAMTRWLRALTRDGPVALVFEDLHWADASSIELLESLIRLAEEIPVLFVGVARPHFAETAERIGRVARERLGDAASRVALQPLTADDALAMLRSLLRGGELPSALLTTIRRRAAGNPFFVEETVRALLDDGALEETRAGELRATSRIVGFEVPGTIQEVIMARVDRQPRDPREVLRAAAAVGLRFPRAVLADVVGREDFSALLDALLDAELIVPETEGGDELRFRHPLIQEVAYDSIVAQRREELHARIGDAIERLVPSEAQGHAAMLAYHYSRGADLARAEAYLFRAGDEAARAAASDEALGFFQEASSLYLRLAGGQGDPVKLATLEQNIAQALTNRGRYADAIEHFDEALRHRGVHVARHPVALGLRLVRDLGVVMARLYLPFLRRGRPEATGAQRAVQELIYERARVQTTSATERYLFDWMDGLRRLESVDPSSMPLAGGQLASTVGIFSYGGVSFAVSERFLAIARESIDPANPEERMIFGFMNFFHAFLAGKWSDDEEVDADLLQDRIQNGQLFDVVNYLGFVCKKRIYQHRFDQAEAFLRTLDEIADLHQYDLALSTYRAQATLRLLEQEEWEAAARAADLYYTEHKETTPNLLALSLHAKALMGAGELDQAERRLLVAEGLVDEAPGVVPRYYASSVANARFELEVARLDGGEGGPERARQAASHALRTTRRVAAHQPEAFRLEGTRRAHAGDARGAARCWERSLEVADHLGAPRERERTMRAARR